jgi:hypothetical protein
LTRAAEQGYSTNGRLSSRSCEAGRSFLVGERLASFHLPCVINIDNTQANVNKFGNFLERG